MTKKRSRKPVLTGTTGDSFHPGLFAVMTRTSAEYRCSVERSKRTGRFCASVYQKEHKLDKGTGKRIESGNVYEAGDRRVYDDHRAQVAKFIGGRLK